MIVNEIMRHVEGLPLAFEDVPEAYLDNRWLLSDSPSTIVMNKLMVRRRIADIYRAINFDPWLVRFTVLDETGHVRVGPFQVLHNGQTRFAHLTFAKTSPLAALFFVELCLAPQKVATGSA